MDLNSIVTSEDKFICVQNQLLNPLQPLQDFALNLFLVAGFILIHGVVGSRKDIG